MELGDTSDEEASPERPKKRELSKSTRIQMVTMLQTLETDDGMRSGSFAMVAECFGVARSTVYRLWNRVVRTHAHGHIISPEFQSHKKNCGRPPIYPSEFVREGINIPLRKRRTQRKLAASLGVSKTTVQHWIVDSTIRVHCNSLKPVLTEENKVARLIMALESRDPNDPSKFLDMMDCVHVDEKWFFLSRQRERYLLLPEKKNPKRCVKSKSHITKLMFLCAVARPRFNTSANSWWDGKLSIWPIGGWEPAQRASKNRPRGTLVWKNKLVTKGVYRELLISKLLPAIVEKWPRTDRLSRKIWIQQDRAKSHINTDDAEFREAIQDQELNAGLYTQAANSPDVNLLDLGFFRAIQSFSNAAPTNEEELIQSLQNAYTNYPRKRLNRTWLTLQSVFNQIILCNGDNDYDIEHLSKEKLKRAGQLPNVLDVVDEASAFDELGITNTSSVDVEESSLLEVEQANQTNENENETNENTMHTHNPS